MSKKLLIFQIAPLRNIFDKSTHLYNARAALRGADSAEYRTGEAEWANVGVTAFLGDQLSVTTSVTLAMLWQTFLTDQLVAVWQKFTNDRQ